MDGSQEMPSSAKLDALALELLQPILCNQSRKDLRSIRLVNKTLDAAAAPFLYQTVAVWINLDSLTALTNISEHPILSQHVKRVVLSPLRFIDQDESVYQSKARSHLANQAESPTHEFLTLGKHMAAYRNYIGAQRLLNADSMDTRILGRAFTAFGRLGAISVDFYNNIGWVQLTSAFGKFSAKDMISCDTEYVLPVLLQALCASGTKLRAIQLGGHGYSMGHASRVHSLVGSSISQTFAMALVHAFKETDVPNYAQAFCELRELEIKGILCEYDYDTPRTKATEILLDAAIHRLIASAPLLENIDLNGAYIGGTEGRNVSCMFSYYHGLALERLRILRLKYFNGSAKVIQDFFRLYASKLEEVHLVGVRARGGDDEDDWPNVLASLRTHGTFPRLKRFYLEYYDDYEDRFDRYALDVQDYILGRTEHNPLVPQHILPSLASTTDRHG